MFDTNAENSIHDFVKGNGDAFKADYKTFFDKFLHYHKGYVPASFPPPIFNMEFINELKDATEFLLEVVFSIPERIFKNDYRALFNYLGYSKDDEEYLLPLCKEEFIKQARLMARPDFLLTEDGLRVIEMNVCNAIGGIGFTDRHAELFYRTGLGKHLSVNNIEVNFHPVAKKHADCLLNNSPNIKNNPYPLVAIVLLDEKELDESHFNSFITYEGLQFLRYNGFRAIATPLKDLDINESGVFYNNKKIDVITTSFTYEDIRDAGQLPFCDKLIESHVKGHVSFFGIPAYSVFDHKANLAILSSDEFSSYFTDDELQKINKYVPKTYKLNNSNVNEAINNKGLYILKNCISSSGNNITIGNNVSADKWKQTLEEILSKDESYIFQKLLTNRVTRDSFVPDGMVSQEFCVGGFYFDGFAGGFIREVPQVKDKTLVINCVSGAKFSAAFHTI